MFMLYLKKYGLWILIGLTAVIGAVLFIGSGGKVKAVFDIMNKLLKNQQHPAGKIDVAQATNAQAKADIKAKEEAEIAKIEAAAKKKLEDAKKNDTTDELADDLWSKK